MNQPTNMLVLQEQKGNQRSKILRVHDLNDVVESTNCSTQNL